MSTEHAETGQALGAALGSPAGQHGTLSQDQSHELARQWQAVSYRLAGLTYEQIAQQMGYTDKGSARRVVIRALAEARDEAVTELRAIEDLRYDRMHAELWQLIVAPRPGQRGADGQPVASELTVDPATRISAIREARQLSERRSKLHGLDAPTKVDLSSGVRRELDDALQQLREAYADDDGVFVMPTEAGSADGDDVTSDD